MDSKGTIDRRRSLEGEAAEPKRKESQLDPYRMSLQALKLDSLEEGSQISSGFEPGSTGGWRSGVPVLSGTRFKAIITRLGEGSMSLEAFRKVVSGTTARMVNERGRSLLHIVAGLNHPEAIEMARVCIERGMGVNLTDDTMTTPLHLACENGDLGTVSLLVKAGASMMAETVTGVLPLFLLAKREFRSSEKPLQLVEEIVEKEPRQLEHRTKDNSTLLHFACRSSRPQSAPIIRYFLSKGCSLMEKNQRGHTPLQLAVAAGCIENVNACLQQTTPDAAITPSMIEIAPTQTDRKSVV